MRKKIILIILLFVLVVFNIGIFFYKTSNTITNKNTPKDCILELIEESMCIDNKKSISYKIKKKNQGGIPCEEVAKSLNKDYETFITNNNIITSTTSCSNCVLKSNTPFYQGVCNGSNILNYYDIQTKSNGGISCIDLVKSLPSTINSNIFIEDENYVITSKQCNDCILDNKRTTPCNGQQVSVTYDIKQSDSNGGKSCIDAISDLESSQGFSNFERIYNTVKGYKDCKDCELGPYNDSRCVMSKIKRTYPIISEPINGGMSCLDKIKSNQQNINDGFLNSNWIYYANTYENDSKRCDDCELSNPEISLCQNNTSTIKFLITKRQNTNGKSCLDIAKSYTEATGYSNWQEEATQQGFFVKGTRIC